MEHVVKKHFFLDMNLLNFIRDTLNIRNTLNIKNTVCFMKRNDSYITALFNV